MNSTSPGIPGFETHELISDGVSTVIAARRRSDGRDVVIKLLDPAAEPLEPKRFDRLHRKLARLADQGMGIVPVLAQGVVADGRHYLILPRYRLGSLQDQIEQGPTPWFPATRLLTRVTEIIGRATTDGEAFGDIRPSKILLDGPDSPFVSVFGMASRRFDDGRPSYRAPEAHNDRPPTSASDVYSLSLVFGALISGHPKEPGETSEDFAARLVDIVPHRIFDVIEHGLAASPTNRYGSAAAMHRALRRATEDEPGAAGFHGQAAVIAHPADPVAVPDGDRSQPPLEPSGLVPEPPAPPFEDERLYLPAGLDDIHMASPTSPPDPLPDAPIEPTNDPVLAHLDPDATTDEEIVDLTELFTRTQEFVYDPGGDSAGPTIMLAGASGTRPSSHPEPAIDLTGSSGRVPATPTPPGPGPASPLDWVEADPTDDPPTSHDAPTDDDPTDDPPTSHDPTDDDPTEDGLAISAVTAKGLIDDDPTEIFVDDDLPSELDTLPPTAPGSPTLSGAEPSGPIPFPNMVRTRPKAADQGPLAALLVRAELVWFQSRRAITTAAAVLGLAAIVVIVVLIALREIRSGGGQIRTQGAPAPTSTPLTTATSSPNVVATQAPFVTDAPPDHDPEHVAPASAVRSAETRATSPTSARVPATTETSPSSSSSTATTQATSTITTAVSQPPPTSATTVTTIDSTTTTKNRGRGRPTTSETIVATTVLPIEPTIDDDAAIGRAATAPSLVGPTLLSLNGSAASVTYSSDTCVATRFRLTGSDGSSQYDSSSAYDADIHCSTAWNLSFDGSSGLDPGVTYSLAVTVKDVAGLTASRTLTFTTPG